MKKILFIFILVFLFQYSFSQNYTVNGMVKDAKTNEPVIGAAVFELGDATVGTATDTEGFFTLHFTKKHILLKVAYIGYKDTTFDMTLKNDTALIVNLLSETDIEEVKIEDDSINWRPEENKLSGDNKPIVVDGADKKDTFQPKEFVIPIKKSEKKTIDKLFVSENNGTYGKIIFLDGARIYNAQQYFRLMPFITKNSVQDYQYYTADFPAEYGGHLAPVLDVTVKEGNMSNYSGQIDFSLFGAGISAQGPVIEDQSSFFISARKSYLNNTFTDIFLKDNSVNEEYWSQPNFWDLNLKYVHKLNDNNQAYVSFFHNYNRLKTGVSEEIQDSIFTYGTNRDITSSYGNTASTIGFKHIFSENFVFNTALIFSSYRLKNTFIGDSTGIIGAAGSYINRYNTDYSTGNSDAVLKLNADYRINNQHNISVGINAENHHFKPIEANLLLNDFEHPNNIDTSWIEDVINAQEYSVFVRDKFYVNNELTINGGLRFSGFVNSGTTYYSVEPRIFADYKIFKFLSLHAGYARHKEYLHLLSGTAAGLSADIFIPSSETVLPQITNHFSAGADVDLPFDIKLKGTVFYDNIANMLEYKDNFSYFDYPGEIVLTGMKMSERTSPVTGNYTGIRTVLSKKYKGFELNIGHTISDFSLKSDSINFGQSYAYRNNHRHDFNLKLSYVLNDEFSFFVNWMYQSGNYVTLQKQHYVPYEYNNGHLGTGNLPDASTVYLTDYTEIPPFDRNDFKLPAYHRLDIGANYILDNHTFGIHIYNVYNQKNPDLIDYKKSVLTNSLTNQLVKYTNLPFFPTISYTYRFNK